MDILLIDPPYTSLKQMAVDRGYNMGLTSLAAYLREVGFDTAVLTADLLLEKRTALVKTLKPAAFQNPYKYAEGQRQYAAIINDKDHEVWQKIKSVIRKTQPKTIGIPYITPLKYTVLRVAALAKEIDKDIKVIVGAFHPTFCPDEVMRAPNIDFLVLGEGEIPLLSLMKELKKDAPQFQNVPGISYRDKDGSVKTNPPAPPIQNLDELPFPARDLVLDCNYKFYTLHSMISARGCPYTCSFCADRRLWGGKVRRRSVPSVVKEMKMMQAKYQPTAIEIVDGTFTFDRKYTQAFCEALIGEGLKVNWRCTGRYDNLDKDILKLMKKAGCSALYLGLESGSDKMLEAIDKKFKVADIVNVNKMVRDAGILLQVSVIMGLPDETREDIEATLDLIRSVKMEFLDINSFIPLPGTPIWDTMTDAEKASIDWLKVGYKSYDNYFSRTISRGDFNNYLTRAYEISSSVSKKGLVRVVSNTAMRNLKNLMKK